MGTRSHDIHPMRTTIFPYAIASQHPSQQRSTHLVEPRDVHVDETRGHHGPQDGAQHLGGEDGGAGGGGVEGEGRDAEGRADEGVRPREAPEHPKEGQWA